MKDMNNIKNLIELYFEGATSLKEEAEIREYFAETSVEEMDSELKQYREYFCYVALNSGMMEELKLKETESVEKASSSRNNRVLIINIGSIAAAVVIMISIVNTIFSPFSQGTEDSIVPSGDTQMISLVINGERVENDDKAITIVEDKLAKLNRIFSKAEERTQESLKKGDISINSIARAQEAISSSADKIDKIVNGINIK